MKALVGSALFLAIAAAGCAGAGPTGGAVTPNLRVARVGLRPATVSITGTYRKGISGSAIASMSNGGDGRIWFVEANVSTLGAIATSGKVTEYAAAKGSQPQAITQNLLDTGTWSGAAFGLLIKSTLDGVQKDYPVTNAFVTDVIMGPDKNLWFSDYGNAMIGRITGKGAVTEFPLPGIADPHGIAVGKDGNFWITDQSYQEIIEMNLSGTVLATYSADFSPGHDQLQYIVAAPDGNLYFTESSSNPTVKARIGRITTAGKIKFIGRLASDSYPDRLTVGKDKNVYFTENGAKKLGKIDTSTGNVSEFALPFAHDGGTSGIVSGSDGRMWLGGYQTIYAVSY